jgi:hypothetical protein
MFIWFEQLSVIVISHMCACFFFIYCSVLFRTSNECVVFFVCVPFPGFFLMTKRCLRINIYIHTYFASRFSWSSSSTTNNEYTCKGNMHVHVYRYLEIITSEGFFFLSHLSMAFFQKALTDGFLSLITMV